MNSGLPVLFLILAAMCIGGMIRMMSLRRILKRDHPSVFARVSGSNVQMANDISFSRFLLSGAYTNSVGPVLRKKLDAMRVFVFAYLLAFAAAIVGLITT
ncbi:hypothetical protein [Actomonas aquatica]|uniref:Uncharacterized protein n=1 Tax=Actomonas aquatica TaxID=2866162 RepID=A0ABZ1C4U6_9BACT|nr:hypothetical protein [Opitutus sp. WL0086]WRQ85524.1 hypothetical protein K1X11_011995 [Opitutus sp. WL0086]